MLGAISVVHHGRTIFWAHCEAEVGVLTLRRSYVGFGMKSTKKVSNASQLIGFNLVPLKCRNEVARESVKSLSPNFNSLVFVSSVDVLEMDPPKLSSFLCQVIFCMS